MDYEKGTRKYSIYLIEESMHSWSTRLIHLESCLGILKKDIQMNINNIAKNAAPLGVAVAVGGLAAFLGQAIYRKLRPSEEELKTRLLNSSKEFREATEKTVAIITGATADETVMDEVTKASVD
jgi:hypothetical protein